MGEIIVKYIETFLIKYPEFRIYEVNAQFFILKGQINNIVSHKEHGEVTLDYHLALHIPTNYPLSPPIIFEESNKIEITLDNHINYDGSFCLGTPHRIQAILRKKPSLVLFFEECVLPFLYSVTIKINSNTSFVFGETAHGTVGIILDLKDLFKLNTIEQVGKMLAILSLPKKQANKCICPCGCNQRLTNCTYFSTVLIMRKYLSRIEWSNLLITLKGVK